VVQDGLLLLPMGSVIAVLRMNMLQLACCHKDAVQAVVLLLLLLLLQAYGHAESQAVTAAITACWSEGELLPLIQKHINRMTLYNLSAAISRLSKLQCQEPTAYDVCLQRFLQLPHIPARNFSNAIYALCLTPAPIRQQHTAAVQQQLVPAFVAKCAEGICGGTV
jgi:hypothetical protein